MPPCERKEPRLSAGTACLPVYRAATEALSTFPSLIRRGLALILWDVEENSGAGAFLLFLARLAVSLRASGVNGALTNERSEHEKPVTASTPWDVYTLLSI